MPNEKTTSKNSDAAVLKILNGKMARPCKARQVIFAQGDPSDAVFYIQKGKVRLTVITKRGKEAIVGVLSEGAFFGEQCLTSEPQRAMTATAAEDSSIIQLEKGRMQRALLSDVEVSERFISHLLLRNKHIYEDFVDHLFNNSEKRLARLLMLLATKEENGDAETVIPRISQEVLAEMVGTTRGRVNFFMNKFKKLGFIDYSDGLVVHRTLLNSMISDD